MFRVLFLGVTFLSILGLNQIPGSNLEKIEGARWCNGYLSDNDVKCSGGSACADISGGKVTTSIFAQYDVFNSVDVYCEDQEFDIPLSGESDTVQELAIDGDYITITCSGGWVEKYRTNCRKDTFWWD